MHLLLHILYSTKINSKLEGASSSNYQPCFPSTMCWATSSGNLTPRIKSSVIPFMASMQASNGERHTYQPAQKNPIGQARNQRQRSQMIAHSTFIFATWPNSGELSPLSRVNLAFSNSALVQSYSCVTF